MPDILAPFDKYLPDDMTESFEARLALGEIHHSQFLKRKMKEAGAKPRRTAAEIAAELEEKAKKRRPRKQFSPKSRYALFKKFNFRCCACGAPATKSQLHIDHIKPVSKYPELASDPDNFQVLCARCNSSKHNRYEDDLR